MKNMKKKIAALALSGVMVVIAGYGTLAYFTDQDTATNEFTVGNVKIDLTETFWANGGQGIENWNNEAKIDNANWGALVEDNKVLWGINQASDIMPTRIIPKNPTITVEKNSEESYIRIIMTMPKDLYDRSNLKTNNTYVVYTFDGMGESWGAPLVREEQGIIALTYTYKEAVKGKVDGNTILEPLFMGIEVSEFANEGDILALNGGFNIDIMAQAIQTEGFASADDAFQAFEGQHAVPLN
ncbi:MAG: SipW-dependent-type signal peptide-containing protein [Cellulosilyticaceae bacterium]